MSKQILFEKLSEIINSKGIKKPLSILDLGCGTASYWKSAHEYFNIKNITGVDYQSDKDISSQNDFQCFSNTIKEINDSLIKNKLESNFIQKEIVNFVCETKEKYDLIICFHILSLLEIIRAKEIILGLEKLLTKTGYILVCLPNKNKEIGTKLSWQNDELDCHRNKFNLNQMEFKEFLKDFSLVYQFEKDEYHWAIIR